MERKRWWKNNIVGPIKINLSKRGRILGGKRLTQGVEVKLHNYRCSSNFQQKMIDSIREK